MENKIPGPEKSYCQLIDDQIEATQAEERANPKPSYFPMRPSSAGYCGRKVAYDYAAYEEILPREVEIRKPNIIRLLGLGHTIENHAISFMYKLPGYKIKYKQQTISMFKLPSGRIFEGSIDLVVEDPNGELCVMDIKSVGNGWNQSFKTRWDSLFDKYERLPSVKRIDTFGFYIEDPMAFLDEVGEDALTANIVQLNLYACGDFLQDRKVSHASVYRYEKNGSQHMEVRFKPCMKLYEATKAKMSLIETAVLTTKAALADLKEGDTIPLQYIEAVPKDYVLGTMACNYCPYVQRCWPGATNKDKWSSTGGGKKKWATKIEEVEGSLELEAMFDRLELLNDASTEKDLLEKEIILHLDSQQVIKVKTAKGKVYDLVQLKSPKPHIELRKGKE